MTTNLFSANRARLTNTLPTHPIILTGHSAIQSANDMSYPFVQDANFWWLTGIDEADWRLILDGSKSYLVAPDIEEIHRIFDGGLSAAEAKAISGVDHALSSAEGRVLIATLAEKHDAVSTLAADPNQKYYGFTLNPAVTSLQRALKKQFKTVVDCRLELAKLRAIKQPHELRAMQRAIDLTNQTFSEVKALLPVLQTEYEIEAEFTYRFRKHNAKHAYEPIVADGKNACTLHYVKNGSDLQQNSLLLLDIGATVDGYAADVTRTYAIGKPTDRQIAVHAAVESAQQQIIALLRPGLSVIEYHEQVDVIMKAALDSIGLLKNDDDYRTYFPHAISHGLGVDVHDSLGRPTEFSPGMVLTVEPGIYIPAESIGVRIEDDILITKDGHINLSGNLPTGL